MTYTFKNKKSGKRQEFQLKISEYDDFVLNHPELERLIETAPAMTYNGKVFGSLDAQTDNGFKEVLAKIGEAHPSSELGNNYRKNKTIKEIKTRDVVKKHVTAYQKRIKK